MARNKYPEETVTRILDESMKLFLEKGYDRTTIQDIIDHLHGLSKGAIYHHFKSKEEILNAATDRIFDGMRQRITEIRDNKELSGREKLVGMFRNSISSPNQIKMMIAAWPDLWKNPQMFMAQFQQVVGETIPVYVEPVIQQGLEDGSIKTEYPKELAQVLMILFSIWLNPLIFQVSAEESARKLKFLMELLHGLNLDFLDEIEGELQGLLAHYAESIEAKRQSEEKAQ